MIVQEILRLLVAVGLGGLIGFERERVDRGAGLRTHALVSTAAALVMLVSSYGFTDVVTANHTVVLDPSRIAAQVVSGIGFLGAGLIIFRRNIVYGLTTAASVWAVAAIGLACGAGMLVQAAVATGLLLLILSGLKPVEQRFFTHKRVAPVTIRVQRQDGHIAAIEEAARSCQLDLWRLTLTAGREEQETLVTLEVRGGTRAGLLAFVEQVQHLPGVKEVIYTGDRAALREVGLEETGEEAGG
jgi:putative Mg2+ transporter-C (MgtC) family protein